MTLVCDTKKENIENVSIHINPYTTAIIRSRIAYDIENK